MRCLILTFVKKIIHDDTCLYSYVDDDLTKIEELYLEKPLKITMLSTSKQFHSILKGLDIKI